MSGGISATTWIAIAAAATSAAAAVYSGQQQKKVAEANAELQRREGVAQQDAAVAQAEKIRKAGEAQAAQANAALGASGVSIGEGTPLRINEDIYRNSESDAYNTILTGARAQNTANAQAGLLQYQGKTAQTAGYINAGASLLQAGSAYSGWKGAAQTPAPKVNS